MKLLAWLDNVERMSDKAQATWHLVFTGLYVGAAVFHILCARTHFRDAARR